MERDDDCRIGNATIISHPKLVYLKRKLEDLEEVHRQGKRDHAAEVERLKADHERTRKANKEQTEQIARLKKHNELTESRLQELKKNVSNSESETRELRVKLRSADAERDRIAGKQADAAEMRKALSATEARKKDEIQERDRRIAELQRALTAEKQRAVEAEAKVRDQRTKLEKEARETRVKNAFIQQQLERTQAELKDAESRKSVLERESSSTSESLAARISDLEATLKLAAEAYSRLSSSSTSLETYQDMKHETARLRIYIARLERKLANSEEQVFELAQLIRQTQATSNLLSEELREAQVELEWHSEESKIKSSLPSSPLEDDSLKSEIYEFLLEERYVEEEGKLQLLGVLQNQLDLSRENGKQLTDYLSSTEHSLANERSETHRLKSKLSESDDVLTKVSQENEALKKEGDSLQEKVTSHAAEIFNLQTKVVECEKALLAAESRARTELAKREELLRKERELTNRLQSTVHKSRMAENALKAEIEQLNTELAGADAYREAYTSIAEEMRGLVARNALAEDEANRLSQFNAEILSHHNPTQKILYVDRIRRELTETKQKLALSTQDQESAMSEIATLRDELAMYKSVSVPFEGKPRTTMTRVRRIPLGAQALNVPKEASQDENYTTFSTTHNFYGDMTMDELE